MAVSDPIDKLGPYFDNTGGTTITKTGLTLSSSVDLITVAISQRDNADDVTAVSWNAVALTKVASKVDGGSTGYISLWRLVAPATGTHNLAITLTAGHHIAFGVRSWSGADQTTPCGTPQSVNGHATGTATLTVTDAGVNGRVIDCGYAFQDATIAATTNLTATADISGSNSASSSDPYYFAGHSPGGASVQMSWGLAATTRYYGYIAVGIKAAATSFTPRVNFLLN